MKIVLIGLSLLGSILGNSATASLVDCEWFLIPKSVQPFIVSGKTAEEIYKFAAENHLFKTAEFKSQDFTGSTRESTVLTSGTIQLIKKTRVEKTLMRGKKPYSFSDYLIDFSKASFEETVAFLTAVSRKNPNPVSNQVLEQWGFVVKGDSAKELFNFMSAMDTVNAANGTNGSLTKYNIQNPELKYTHETETVEKHEVELFFDEGGMRKTGKHSFELVTAKEVRKETIVGIEYTYTYWIGEFIDINRTVYFDKATNTYTDLSYSADFTFATPKQILQLAEMFAEYSFHGGKKDSQTYGGAVSRDNDFFKKSVTRALLYLLKK